MADATESTDSAEFESLLEFLQHARGFDFTTYKRATLGRRIQKRMRSVDIGSYADYIDYLEVHPEEFEELFNTILINMTGFFRDRPAWDYLDAQILPRMLADKSADQPIRIWSAGCATGEEAYSIAMLLARRVGPERFRERVKIYATDIDEEALSQARQATYSARAVRDVEPEFLASDFEEINQQFSFRKDLRRSIIFGRNNLVHDAPISRIDLLICRNTLMYFNAEAQSRILAHLHFALTDGGYLFLGKGEMLLTHGDLFNPVDLRRRVFSKVPTAGARQRANLPWPVPYDPDLRADTSTSRLRSEAFNAGQTPQIIVDPAGVMVLANQQARLTFSLTTQDIGRPLQDLEISYRPIELRSLIEQATTEHRPVLVRDLEWRGASEERHLDVHVVPLVAENGVTLGTSVTFTDVTRTHRLVAELQRSSQELETAYEELQSTIEELETTNEELQSTNEELETTNEELQSTNEELETMNEELQSANEELETINAEFRVRTSQLDQANIYLESILTSLRSGVVVLDDQFDVHVWNSQAAELWGLRADEVQGMNFLSLDIGLPVEELRQPIRACLAGQSESVETTLDATNRRGQAIRCKVACMPLAVDVPSSQRIQGVILLMDAERADGLEGAS